jgi:hypothetical protein
MVMKNVGLPRSAAMVSEAANYSVAHRFDPMNEEGR